MPTTAAYAPLTELAKRAGLAVDDPLVALAEAEQTRLMQRLGGEASDREAWLVALCVQYRVQLEAALTREC